LDGKAFQGRLMHVLDAKEKIVIEDPSTKMMMTAHHHLTLKERKKIERKKSTAGWNASYIRSDATVDALASRLAVKKGEILDKENAGNMAVRVAIGETMLLQENQAFFEAAGVNIQVYTLLLLVPRLWQKDALSCHLYTRPTHVRRGVAVFVVYICMYLKACLNRSWKAC
jgi:hypothetical protein